MTRAEWRSAMPGWQWAYTVFRFADGLTHALFPLAVVLVYGGPVWMVAAVAALMNLAGVPAAFLWARLMDGGRYRRRAAVAGFAVAAATLALLSVGPPFWVFLAAATAFSVFGVATAPAASVLVLEGVERSRWAAATGDLSRRTGAAYLAGVTAVTLLGLAGGLRLDWVFLAAAVASAAAAVVAHQAIRPFEAVAGAPAAPRRFDMALLVAGLRRFERAVFFPGRLRHRPTWSGVRVALSSGPAPLLVAVALLFFGTVVLLAAYPGILVRELMLGEGWVLLAMAPASFLAPALYGAAGRAGDRFGTPRALARGAGMRLAAVPGMCLVLLLAGLGVLQVWPALLLLLVLHGLMGASFAYLQVNGSCLAAALHPRRAGDGVGAFHAALGLGTVAGSVAAAALLLLFPAEVTYGVAAAAVTSGCLLLMAFARRVPAPT